MAVYPDDVSLELKIEELADSLLYLPFDSDSNDASGNGNTPSTESGGIIFPAHITPQVGAGAVQLAEATTNLIVNPIFENNVTDGWSTGANTTATHYTSDAYMGSASCKVATTGSDMGIRFIKTDTFTRGANDDVTIQVRVKAISSSVQIAVALYGSDWGNAAATSWQTITSGDGWVYITLTVDDATMDGWSSPTNLFLVINNGADAGADKEFLVDAVQAETKSYPTPICHGSLGEGHSWSGAAHNSTSSRTATDLRYPNSVVSDLSHTGTIAFWAMTMGADPDDYKPATADYFMFAECGYGGAGVGLLLGLYMQDDGSGGQRSAVPAWWGAIPGTAFYGSTMIQPYEWHHYVFNWDGTDIYIYLDGNLEATKAQNDDLNTGASTLKIGQWGTTNHINAVMDDFVVLDRALTDEEVQILYRDGSNGVSFEGVWNDIIEDVRVGEQINLRYGILGHGELMRQAGAGTLQFALKNDTTNSGGLEGYYSPGHANARSGFDLGRKVRLVIEEGSADYYKFVGRLTQITPVPGKKRERKTICIAQDWLYAASKHPVNLIDVQENIRSDEMVQIIVDNLDSAPESISLEQGQETFTYVADDFKDEKTMAMAALDRVTRSEFGFCYIRGNTNGGGELTFEDRHRRVTETTIQATIDDNDIFDMNVRRDIEEVFNRIIATAYPREVSDTDEILYSLYTPIEIPPNSSKTIRARYSDPDNRDVRLGGKDFLDPEGKNELVEQGSADDRGFEGGVGSWTVSGGGPVARSSSYAKKGTYSLKYTSGTGSSNVYGAQSARLTGFVQNDVVYYQIYVNVPDIWPGNVKVLLQERNSAGGFLANLELADLATSTSGWVRVAGSITLTNASTAKVNFWVGNPVASNFSGGAVTLYIDEAYIIHESELNFEFSSSESGGGDKNVYLELINSTLSGNSAEFVLNNLSDDTGYVTQLKVRGKAIRTYDPIEYRADDSDSIESYFLRPMKMDLRYIADPFVAQDFATIVLSRTKDPHTFVESVVIAGNKSQTLLDAVLGLEPGDRIDIAEEVSGIDAEHFINGVEMRLIKAAGGVAIFARYFPRVASLDQFWSLGVAGLGELGIATKLAF